MKALGGGGKIATIREGVAAADAPSYDLAFGWGSFGTGDGQLFGPQTVAVDASGVYVGDESNRVQKFTRDGTFLARWGSTGSGDGQFLTNHGLLVGSTADGSSVFVSDAGINARVQKFTLLPLSEGCPADTTEIPAEGLRVCLVTKWGSLGGADGEFNTPYGLAVSRSGEIFVGDSSNQRVQVFRNVALGDSCPLGTKEIAANGAERTCFVRKWGSFGSGPGQFFGPLGIALDDVSGDVYVADTFNNRVQRFTTTGSFLLEWGSAGVGDAQFDRPQGLAIDTTRDLAYIADTGNHRVEVFTTEGDLVTTFGGPGSAPGQLYFPSYLALDAAGRVYVSDEGNNRVQAFERTDVHGPAVSVASGATLSLASGDYASITTSPGSTLRLTGGVYRTNHIVLGDSSRLQFVQRSELRTFGRLTTGTKAFIGPAPSSKLTALDVRVAVLTGDGTVTDAQARALVFGEKTTATGLFYVPFGSVQLDAKVKLTGDVCAPGTGTSPPSLAPDATTSTTSVQLSDCGNEVHGSNATFGGGNFHVWLDGFQQDTGTCETARCNACAAANGKAACNTSRETGCGQFTAVSGQCAFCGTTPKTNGTRCSTPTDVGSCEFGACRDQRVDLPFSYGGYIPGSPFLRVAGGPARDQVVFASIGAFGSHTHGGHASGESKANTNVFLRPRRESLTELALADFNGVCDPGETCGMHYQDIEDRIPQYELPLDAQVVGINFNGPSLWAYQHAPQWVVHVTFNDKPIGMNLGGMRRLPHRPVGNSAVYDLLQAKYPGLGRLLDPDPSHDCNDPTLPCTAAVCCYRMEDFSQGLDVVKCGSASIARGDCRVWPPEDHSAEGTPLGGTLAKGALIGEMQVARIEPVDLFPDYFVLGGDWPVSPIAGVEYSLFNNVQGGEVNHQLCQYDLLPAASEGRVQQSDLQEAMYRDMTAALVLPFGSQRFSYPRSPPWQWGAEGLTCMTQGWDYEPFDDDVSQLYNTTNTALEVWYDRTLTIPIGNEGHLTSDKFVAFFPIAPSLFASENRDLWRVGTDPEPEFIAVRGLNSSLHSDERFTWNVPQPTQPPAQPAVVYKEYTLIAPVFGEVLVKTSDRLLIRWRHVGVPDSNIFLEPFYQAVAYRLDAQGLTIKWSTSSSEKFYATLGDAEQDPVKLTSSETCDGKQVICYDHSHPEGYFLVLTPSPPSLP